MSMSQSQPAQADPLREYLRILRARAWEIALITLLVIGATLFLVQRQTPIYQGQAQVLVNSVSDPLDPLVAAQAPNLVTEQQLVASQAVALQVKAATHSPFSAAQLLANLSVSVVSTTDILQIDYSDPSPAVAAQMANAFASAYVSFRTDQLLARLRAAQGVVRTQISQVQREISVLNAKIAKTTDPTALNALQTQMDSYIGQLGALQQQEASLQPTPGANLSAGSIIQHATLPTSPSSPRKIRDGALAVIAGLALGVGFAFLRERLDDRVKTREELEQRVGAPVIAAIPKAPAWRRPEDAYLVTRADSHNPVAEAYRTLATNIQYLATQRELKVLVVTSAESGEGKTVTAANLAVVLAQTGKRVALLSDDLRRPRLHRFFDLPNDQGISDVLQGKLELGAIAHEVGTAGLRVLPAGPVPASPAELLAGRANAELMTGLRGIADFIVVDTQPVLAVADASILTPLSDGVLYVIDAANTSRSTIEHARDQLDHAGATIVGAVFNNFDPSRARTYPYYASYRRYYGSSPDGAATNGGRRRSRRSRRRAAQPDAVGVSEFFEGGPAPRR